MDLAIIVVIPFVVWWIVAAGKFWYTGLKFRRYIKEKYPRQWDEMVNTDIVARVLFSFKKGTLPYFMYKSTDTLNDEKIAGFRRKYRRHFFVLAAIIPLSFLCFGILLIIFLETMGKYN